RGQRSLDRGGRGPHGKGAGRLPRDHAHGHLPLCHGARAFHHQLLDHRPGRVRGHAGACGSCDGGRAGRVEGDRAERWDERNRVPKGYERRRVKARIEKIARVQHLPSITRDFADANLDEAYAPVAEVVSDRLPPAPKPATETPLTWTDEAVQRMERVPGGFMR